MKMKWYWKVCVVFPLLFLLAVYLSYMQHHMVFAWLTDTEYIKDNIDCAFIEYSSDHIPYARECSKVTRGWDALVTIWPLSLTLVIVSLAVGIAVGFVIRDNKNATSHKHELSYLENRYEQRIKEADVQYKQTVIMESESRRRFSEVIAKETHVKSREKLIKEKELHFVGIVKEKVRTIELQHQKLQEEYQKRHEKMERLEKNKTDLKRQILSLEKDVHKLLEKNISLMNENQSLKGMNKFV